MKKRSASKTTSDDVIMYYLPFVKRIAERVHRRLPPFIIDLEDLIHSGIIGLLEALKRYDPARGVEFSHYAHYRIAGEIMEYLRSLDLVSRSVRKWKRDTAIKHRNLVQKLGREATQEEIAKESGIPLERFYELERKPTAVLRIEDLSIALDALETTLETTWDDASLTIQNQTTATETIFEEQEVLEKIRQAIRRLPDQELIVIRLYCEQELTLAAIGSALDISEGRACQIFNEAVLDLQYILEHNEL